MCDPFENDLPQFGAFAVCAFVSSSFSLCVSEYAQVTKMLGNGRLEAMCFDGTKRLCHIRGKLRKKVCVIPLKMICLN